MVGLLLPWIAGLEYFLFFHFILYSFLFPVKILVSFSVGTLSNPKRLLFFFSVRPNTLYCLYWNQGTIQTLSDFFLFLFLFFIFSLPLLELLFIFIYVRLLLCHSCLIYDGTPLKPQLTLFYLILLYHSYMEGGALTRLQSAVFILLISSPVRFIFILTSTGRQSIPNRLVYFYFFIFFK